MYKRGMFKLFFVLYIALVLAVTGCADRKSRFKELNIQESLREIVIRYVNAEYSGDNEELITLTKEAAQEAVKSGELSIFKNHKLNGISSIYFEKQKESTFYRIKVTVSSTVEDSTIPSQYYEHILFKNYGNKWYIVKVERDT